MPSAVATVSTMHSIQPTELRELILPILACLPTAFFSNQPAPALLPLLSPILRQRVHLLASSSQSEPTSQGSWLKLLTWSSERAERLVDIVSRLQLEPHPVSGELELFGDSTDPDDGKVWYRRLDEETVQARCDIKEYNLGFVYVWSTGDNGGVGLESTANGGAEDAWKVAEVVPLEGDENLELEGWKETLTEAEQSGSRSMQSVTSGLTAPQTNGNHLSPATVTRVQDEDDEDDYWAAYDRTPGKATPAATRNPSVGNIFGNQGQSEQDYFARYGEVQPAMDNHDPDEEEVATEMGVPQNHHNITGPSPGQPHDRNSGDDYAVFKNLNDAIEQQAQHDIAMPVPRSGAETNHHTQNDRQPSPAVASMERSASETSTGAETSVKQHISHEIKSLFRLAQGVGIEREEFNEIVSRELEVLGQIEL